MKNKICGFLAIISCLFLLYTNAQAESFSDYVKACKADLGFNDADVPKSFDCTKADKFAPVSMGPRVNDYMGYARITDDVDLVFACRWLQAGVYDPLSDFQQGPEFTQPPFRVARSVEMLIHNRKKGSTCYFKSKDQTLTLPPDPPRLNTSITRSDVTPVIVVSPIVAATAAPGTPEANFWVSPTELDQKLPCVDCHVSGPYIATPRISYALARHGLLNNGHDTLSLFPNTTSLDGHYHAVGSTFSHFNNLIAAKNTDGTCAGSCHNIAYGASAVPDVLGVPHDASFQDAILLPSIAKVFSPALPPFDPRFAANVSVLDDRTSHAMPPSDDTSNYRAINSDTPGDGVEIETFTASKNRFPVVQYGCGVPRVLEAHAVGSDVSFFATDPQRPNVNPAFDVLPDKLRIFNTREGLVCINADQPNGKQCNNYKVQYFCSNGSQSGVYDADQPTYDGDHEERTNHANICGGLPVMGIQASTVVNGQTVTVTGPNDRLAQFTSTGLVCKNSDQPNGATCSNYVVRYEDCRQWSEAYLAKIKNSWTSPPTFGDRYLTTTANNVNDAETRAQANNYQYPSQDWVIEAVAGTNNFRLKDTWSGKYLTESLTNNSSGLAIVVVHNSDLSLMRQQWIVDDVPNSTTGEKYLRNVGTSRYLTVGNYTSDPYFAPIVSQALSNQNWASQRWLIQ